MHPVPWLFTEMLKLNWAPINDKEILIKKVEKRKKKENNKDLINKQFGEKLD